jgi:hypothetical protein
MCAARLQPERLTRRPGLSLHVAAALARVVPTFIDCSMASYCFMAVPVRGGLAAAACTVSKLLKEKSKQTPVLHALCIKEQASMQAALRRAVGELIFFAGVNDLERCQKIVSAWGIKLDDHRCADYDKRTPLCAAPLQAHKLTCCTVEHAMRAMS